MTCGEGAQCATGCGSCVLWLLWLGFGIAAAVSGYDDAVGCGWWLYVMFIVQLVYMPFAVVFGAIYSGLAYAALCEGSPEDTATGNACGDGFLRGALFFVLNVLGGVVAGLSGKAIWDGNCRMDGTRLRAMAEVGFYATAVVTGIAVIVGMAEGAKALIHRCVG